MAETAPREIEEGEILPLDERRPFLDHLEELRRRLLRCFLWTGLGMASAWRAAPQILELLIRPVGQVVFLSPTEPFLVHLKAAFLGGLVLSCPLLAWEVWGFFRPALPVRGRGAILALLPLSAGLFLAGAWFGWQWLLPSALKILLSFGGGMMQPMLTVNSYVGFASWLIIGCGLIFQVPLVILFLAAAGLVRPAALLRHWRAAVVAILITAAVLTPTPDIFTQLLLAGPLAALYLVSVLLAFMVSFFSHRRVADAAAGEG
jgi:sec-independent protein translocase protein TatC